jgi:hypothetical protein
MDLMMYYPSPSHSASPTLAHPSSTVPGWVGGEELIYTLDNDNPELSDVPTCAI